jgi:hypothetical protein
MTRPSEPIGQANVLQDIGAAERLVTERVKTLEHPFQHPDIELIAALWPQ